MFQGKRPYSHIPLETNLKELYGESKLHDKPYPRVLVTTVVADRQPTDLYLFRSYVPQGKVDQPAACTTAGEPLRPGFLNSNSLKLKFLLIFASNKPKIVLLLIPIYRFGKRLDVPVRPLLIFLQWSAFWTVVQQPIIQRQFFNWNFKVTKLKIRYNSRGTTRNKCFEGRRQRRRKY